MTGRPSRMRPLRGRLSSWPALLLTALLSWTSLTAAAGDTATFVRIASAAVASAPAQADAADFVPTVANLPPGFREDWTDAVGGDIQPTVALRRAFVALDDSRRLVVGVSIGASEAGAQTSMDDQVNQLTRFQGWRFNPSSAFGDSGFRGSRTNPDGGTGTMALFRIQAVTAEIAVYTQGGVSDVALVDNVARLVVERIKMDPDVVTVQAGWPTSPVLVPGKEPAGAPTGSGRAGIPTAPGTEVTGSSSGSPVTGDTVVLFTVTGIDRPWASGNNVPRPPSGMEYLAVEVQIEVVGPTEAIVALTDFSVLTYDGRFWTPVAGRSPGLRTGNVSMAGMARGWLSFMIPTDQPALQLTWRLRTNQPTAPAGDQTLVVPLTEGATATASVGATPPPAGVPVSPPNTAPGAPTTPGSPPAPSSPSTPGGGSGGGGGGGTGGGPRLQ